MPVLERSLLLVTNIVVENFLAVAFYFYAFVEVDVGMSNQTENLGVDLKHLLDSDFVQKFL